jgi:predicted PurR-regulated permease PerM
MLAGVLAKVAFSAFGKPITVKAILLAILGILVAVGLFFAVRFINQHFQHIKDLETENAQLQRDKATLIEQKKQLIQTNKDNEQTRVTENQIHTANQGIATEERHASQQRAAQYKDISHAIQAAPVSTAPVPPVISNTLDELWGPAPKDHQ